MIWHQNKKFNYQEDFIQSSYLSGCFLLLDPKAFKFVNGFDEKFFLHMEDADLVRKDINHR